MKNTLVHLVVTEGDVVVMEGDYSIAHATNILRMRNNGGWHLPADSKYKFTAENGIELLQRQTKRQEDSQRD